MNNLLLGCYMTSKSLTARPCQPLPRSHWVETCQLATETASSGLSLEAQDYSLTHRAEVTLHHSHSVFKLCFIAVYLLICLLCHNISSSTFLLHFYCFQAHLLYWDCFFCTPFVIKSAIFIKYKPYETSKIIKLLNINFSNSHWCWNGNPGCFSQYLHWPCLI